MMTNRLPKPSVGGSNPFRVAIKDNKNMIEKYKSQCNMQAKNNSYCITEKYSTKGDSESSF